MRRPMTAVRESRPPPRRTRTPTSLPQRPPQRPPRCPASPARRDRNAEVDFRGERRSNATHASTTDPDARLFRKSRGTGAILCFMGHTLMENRNGLIVQAELTHADGHAERRAALDMIHRHSPGSTRRLTLGADKGYDSAACGVQVRTDRVVCAVEGPHVWERYAGLARQIMRAKSASEKRSSGH